ncbi:multidrug efflux RND transporter permease subunit [Steroidobacter agaridevorans]|uniref:Efflux pump membrane transporter n=1 Tax=Steroidobacter agaridevorans TaxID=2695856 RepID=A0A829Y4R9_9GAMM|nr:multidrug efflux RND transporter permease subunit [Steroidobacter agaridevorans]GFE78210.1 multidrug efflux RND transporter permease subunit [Steroidobacter agaridevorans]
MKFARFFIDRPIFAAVVSIIIFLVGAIAMWQLPISQYPEVVPPTVVVNASYPGANPKVIAETVAAPLEQEINGVENMLYMSSQAMSDGQMTLTVTFRLGTNIDTAQVQVQNRVAQALPRLPEDVRRVGVTTLKASPDLLMVVHLTSPDGRYDTVYLRNYATLQIRDVLARLPGMGDVRLFGSGDYSMRVWLDPERIASRGLTAGDVVNAIREQNVQVAAGVIGADPAPANVDYQLNVTASGRLITEEQFGDIIVKTLPDGSVTTLKDVARIELDAAQYSLRSLLGNKSAVAIPVSQSPGANALELSDAVRATMKELSKNFPEGVSYEIVYDPTIFVRDSIKAVIKTLLEALALVVIVVIVFLQTWRASIIPLLAVPVSIIGTFALMLAFGFSINALSLFGLVLAIGIVVDDAIVVVENVERNIESGLSPLEATYKAMDEVSGPIIAIALVLVAVFVPIAFITGLTGEFYKQFALTIAISTVISAINSLTLSPALASLLLKPHGAKPDALTRGMDKVLGRFFRAFNNFFHRSGDKYVGGVRGVLRHKSMTMGAFALLLVATWGLFQVTPKGFIPVQDKQYLITLIQLPNAASLNRTEQIVREVGEIGMKVPGVHNAVQFPGLSVAGFTNSSNSAIVFFALDDFDKRKSPELSGFAIAQQLNGALSSIKEAQIVTFPPPPVNGLGTLGGFKLQLEDRADLGYDELYKATQAVIAKARQAPELTGVFSNYEVNVPQILADVNRVKAKEHGVPLNNVFETLQVYLASQYVNDFNRFGRTYKVIAQADYDYRAKAEDILRLKTRNEAGEMVPLGSVVQVSQTYGPDRVFRYNGYLTADINGGPAPGYSTGQAKAVMERILAENLPNGVKYEWTDLTYQEILVGNSSVFVFPLCVLLVVLVLAALYESWTLPLAIVAIVPMALLSAIFGVWITGGDNNIFTQIALFVLVGLASKNAILIVEFAKDREKAGVDPYNAALEAARLRLRPILMTSIAFIMGVVPLVLASGAGAEMRHAIGIAVFSGMLGVTFFGLFLTPVFYVLLRAAVVKKFRAGNKSEAIEGAAHHA